MKNYGIHKIIFLSSVFTMIQISTAHSQFFTQDLSEITNTISTATSQVQAVSSTIQSTLSVGNIQQALGDAVGSMSKFQDAKEKVAEEKAKAEKKVRRAQKLVELQKEWVAEVKQNVQDAYDEVKGVYDAAKEGVEDVKSEVTDVYNAGKDLYDEGKGIYEQGKDIYEEGKSVYDSAKDMYGQVADSNNSASSVGGDASQDEKEDQLTDETMDNEDIADLVSDDEFSEGAWNGVAIDGELQQGIPVKEEGNINDSTRLPFIDVEDKIGEKENVSTQEDETQEGNKTDDVTEGVSQGEAIATDGVSTAIGNVNIQEGVNIPGGQLPVLEVDTNGGQANGDLGLAVSTPNIGMVAQDGANLSPTENVSIRQPFINKGTVTENGNAQSTTTEPVSVKNPISQVSGNTAGSSGTTSAVSAGGTLKDAVSSAVSTSGSQSSGSMVARPAVTKPVTVAPATSASTVNGSATSGSMVARPAVTKPVTVAPATNASTVNSSATNSSATSIRRPFVKQSGAKLQIQNNTTTLQAQPATSLKVSYVTRTPLAYAQVSGCTSFKTGTTNEGNFIFSDVIAKKCCMNFDEITEDKVSECVKTWVMGMNDANAETATEWKNQYNDSLHDHVAADLNKALEQKNYSANFETDVADDLDSKSSALSSEREEVSFVGKVNQANQEVIIRLMEATTGQVITEAWSAVRDMESSYYNDGE